MSDDNETGLTGEINNKVPSNVSACQALTIETFRLVRENPPMVSVFKIVPLVADRFHSIYTDAGEILQLFELNLLPSKIGALDDIVAIVDVPEYQRGRIYA